MQKIQGSKAKLLDVKVTSTNSNNVSYAIAQMSTNLTLHYHCQS